MIKNTARLMTKVFIFMILAVSLVAILIFSQFPSDSDIKGCIVTKLYQVNLCPKSKDYVRLSQINDFVKKAVLVSEDSSFYQHKGFDFQEVERSIRTNLARGKLSRGGSTITQQLAKNMFLSKDKTLTRKFMEALITLRIERVLSKSEILEKYLNIVQFGKNLFGVKNAAEYYFNKTPSQLTLPEASFLAFLLPSPEKYSQSFGKRHLTPFARKRLNHIIDKLFVFSMIDSSQHMVAKNEMRSFLNKNAVNEEDMISDEELSEEQLLENEAEEAEEI